jgi:P27 family predicted phage terminase small subunit
MGKGRKPKPIAAQLAAGDPRRHGIRKLSDRLAAEPKATSGLPPCPEHIVCESERRAIQLLRALQAEIPPRFSHYLDGAILHLRDRRACMECIPCRARAAWAIWSEELAVMDLDRRADAQMLEGACISYAQAVDADLTISREGQVVRIQSLDPQTKEPIEKQRPHAAIAISRAAWAQVRAFCSEFGLTPVARTRLAADSSAPKEKQTDLFALLATPREARPVVSIQ